MRVLNGCTRVVMLLLVSCAVAFAQGSRSNLQNGEWLGTLTQPHDYVQKRSSSYDRSGGNADYRPIAPQRTAPDARSGLPGKLCSHFLLTVPGNCERLIAWAFTDGCAWMQIEIAKGWFVSGRLDGAGADGVRD